MFRLTLSIAFSATMAACGGGGGATTAAADPEASEITICRAALVSYGVATPSMLAGAQVSLMISPPPVKVVFHNAYLPGDVRYHVFGACKVQDGAAAIVGQ